VSLEVEFRLSVGAQYEYVNVRVSAVDAADLAQQLDAFGDGDGLNIGHMQAVLSGVVRRGYNNPGSAPIETDSRAPETLIQEELGGKVVAVQEQAAEVPRKAWEVPLPAAPKAWEGVAAEAIKAQAAVKYPSGPPVESPKDEFPDW